ncbi:zinc finger dihydrouridine synthase [Ephemerocybe angulata]|uniref:tRNA-dihydrouridine(47) synthase [NAD(P)(+)] n=1 Tax=Ephemerocybe angulata TaxID=980116 RepID=A0A8H6M7Y7_9AGAR|nr:zinc finger dihydrouridine synthase [Tulosesus angulatus]
MSTESAPRKLPPGTVPIKEEFLVFRTAPAPQPINDDAAEGVTATTTGRDAGDRPVDSRDQPGNGGKKSWKSMSKAEKNAQKGQNKGRRFKKERDELELCWKVANGAICDLGTECRFSHDIDAYLAAKPQDLRVPSTDEFTDKPPFGPDLSTLVKPHPRYPNVDTATVCPIFAEAGECRYGYKCRFLGGHIAEGSEGNLTLAQDETKKAQAALTAHEMNFIGAENQKRLRSKRYPLPISTQYLRDIAPPEEKNSKPIVIDASRLDEADYVAKALEVSASADPAETEPAPTATEDVKMDDVETTMEKRTGDANADAAKDTPDVPMRSSEKNRLDWKGKTYLAPLTTVGNLPFRRLCVKLGADITCGEMGLAPSFLAGSREEWSLVRRHPSERTFGVQVAGNKPQFLVPTAEVLAKEFPSGLDFVDLNCGCPIDLVFKAGSGSALLDAAGKLGRIIVGMQKALGAIPLTVKLRTGVKDGKNNAHKLMPRIAAEWGASAMTLHGRTRQQRYTRLADWEYIGECVKAVREREEAEDLAPVPIFGGGDCFSAQDYWEKVEGSGVDGIMIARGALIKPWIFTEVKERREWDISARERLDLIRDYAEFGLNHFGSDTTGVNATRRYLCEALSFQYRYVPIGLLETLPPKINERAPAFRGRNELETLMASGDSQDWVKISEMFLGPAPPTWSFMPKHKSNAYGSEEGQG